MKRNLISLVTAAAIATAGISATPAQADPAEDLVKLLIGAAIIGAVIDSTNNGNSRVTVTHGNTRPYASHRNNNGHRNYGHNNNGHRNYGHNNGHRHNGHRQVQLPQQCVVYEHTRRGWIETYKPRCMARFGFEWRHGRWVPGRHAHR